MDLASLWWFRRKAVAKAANSRRRDIGLRARKMRGLDSLGAGAALLAQANLGRGRLERMARGLDVPISRSDTSTRLVEKIVEALIGARLSSQAVRGGLL